MFKNISQLQLSQLSHILLHSAKFNIFNYLTDINLLTRL